MDQKIVLLHGFTREETIAAMKAVKAAVSGAADAAFATSTPTNLTWKLADIVEHVAEEHRMFKEAGSGAGRP
ncbi:MAG: DUF3783 domain-containing protein [Spirochaetaceae bacterium]|nr:DUF3783 domain-containing protein [Spirochaetaceae bacterium]